MEEIKNTENQEEEILEERHIILAKEIIFNEFYNSKEGSIKNFEPNYLRIYQKIKLDKRKKKSKVLKKLKESETITLDYYTTTEEKAENLSISIISRLNPVDNNVSVKLVGISPKAEDKHKKNKESKKLKEKREKKSSEKEEKDLDDAKKTQNELILEKKANDQEEDKDDEGEENEKLIDKNKNLNQNKQDQDSETKSSIFNNSNNNNNNNKDVIEDSKNNEIKSISQPELLEQKININVKKQEKTEKNELPSESNFQKKQETNNKIDSSNKVNENVESINRLEKKINLTENNKISETEPIKKTQIETNENQLNKDEKQEKINKEQILEDSLGKEVSININEKTNEHQQSKLLKKTVKEIDDSLKALETQIENKSQISEIQLSDQVKSEANLKDDIIEDSLDKSISKNDLQDNVYDIKKENIIQESPQQNNTEVYLPPTNNDLTKDNDLIEDSLDKSISINNTNINRENENLLVVNQTDLQDSRNLSAGNEPQSVSLPVPIPASVPVNNLSEDIIEDSLGKSISKASENIYKIKEFNVNQPPYNIPDQTSFRNFIPESFSSSNNYNNNNQTFYDYPTLSISSKDVKEEAYNTSSGPLLINVIENLKNISDSVLSKSSNDIERNAFKPNNINNNITNHNIYNNVPNAFNINKPKPKKKNKKKILIDQFPDSHMSFQNVAFTDNMQYDPTIFNNIPQFVPLDQGSNYSNPFMVPFHQMNADFGNFSPMQPQFPNVIDGFQGVPNENILNPNYPLSYNPLMYNNHTQNNHMQHTPINVPNQSYYVQSSKPAKNKKKMFKNDHIPPSMNFSAPEPINTDTQAFAANITNPIQNYPNNTNNYNIVTSSNRSNKESINKKSLSPLSRSKSYAEAVNQKFPQPFLFSSSLILNPQFNNMNIPSRSLIISNNPPKGSFQPQNHLGLNFDNSKKKYKKTLKKAASVGHTTHIGNTHTETTTFLNNNNNNSNSNNNNNNNNTNINSNNSNNSTNNNNSNNNNNNNNNNNTEEVPYPELNSFVNDNINFLTDTINFLEPVKLEPNNNINSNKPLYSQIVSSSAPETTQPTKEESGVSKAPEENISDSKTVDSSQNVQKKNKSKKKPNRKY